MRGLDSPGDGCVYWMEYFRNCDYFKAVVSATV